MTGRRPEGDGDDRDSFRRAVADVRPLADDGRIVPPPRGPTGTVRAHAPPPIEPAAELAPGTFGRPGLRDADLRRLRRGPWPLCQRLDLHGLTTGGAARALADLLADARAAGCRHLLVIHGRGLRSEQGRPVLKSFAIDWLRRQQAVLLLMPARPEDGGDGACYVLLRRQR